VLMVDPFGNYLVQKLLDVASDEQRTQILRAVSDPPRKRTAGSAQAAEGAAQEAAPERETAKADGSQSVAEPMPLSAAPGGPVEEPAEAESSGLDALLATLPQLVTAALNPHGTRSVQKLVETLSSEDQLELAIAALSEGVMVLMLDANGNHVVQRCLQRLSSEQSQFIYDAVSLHFQQVARHRHGCCVLQRCIDHASEAQQKVLIACMAEQALVLSQDPFGNYVVQYVLGLCLPWASAMVMARLGNNYAQLSLQKFSSNVVEKCLKLSDGPLEECRAAIVRELTLSPLLERLLQDPYGNYVVQSALIVSKGTLYDELVAHIRPHIASVKSSPYGKRILARSNLLGKPLTTR